MKITSHVIIVLIGIYVSLAGCTSIKTLQAEPSSESISSKQLNARLAIINTHIKGKQITAEPRLVSLTVIYGDALLESIKNTLTGHFKTIDIVDQTDALRDYDYVLTPTNNIRGVCGAVFLLNV